MNKINKYANGKIYCIRCKDTDKRYYGSTYEIFLVKDFPCYSRKELYKEEYNIIKENDLIYDVVNKVGKK